MAEKSRPFCCRQIENEPDGRPHAPTAPESTGSRGTAQAGAESRTQRNVRRRSRQGAHREMLTVAIRAPLAAKAGITAA